MGFINIPTPTIGGKVFWETLKSKNGWRLQRNMFTHHYRIIDPGNIRRDWDTDFEKISRTFDIFTGNC